MSLWTSEREAWKYTSLKSLESKSFAARQATVLCDSAFAVKNDAGITQLAIGKTGADPIILSAGMPIEGEGQATHRLIVDVADGVQAVLVEQQQDLANNKLDWQANITVGQGASLLHLRLLQGSVGAYHFSGHDVTVAQGGHYRQMLVQSGFAISRHAPNISLQGREAKAELAALFVQANDTHADMTATMNHLAEAAQSRQHVRMVLQDKARGVFKGCVKVAQAAQKTDAYQMSRALQLSPQAEFDAKPELEIFADDVKCSHGCAIGALDEQALFYLRARGVPEPEAKALLVQAFMQDLWPDDLPEAVQAIMAERVLQLAAKV
jgi:Fe-S cluster assembly protein SufD